MSKTERTISSATRTKSAERREKRKGFLIEIIKTFQPVSTLDLYSLVDKWYYSYTNLHNDLKKFLDDGVVVCDLKPDVVGRGNKKYWSLK